MRVLASASFARLFGRHFLSTLIVTAVVALWAANLAGAQESRTPEGRAPKPVEITELPLPPEGASDTPPRALRQSTRTVLVA